MKKMLCSVFYVLSTVGGIIGYYHLYQRQQAIEQKIQTLEEVLKIYIQEENKKEEKKQFNSYQRLQFLDDKLGEWIKKR